jgi:putative Mg2+ transporter-C (MgtC) family protein
VATQPIALRLFLTVVAGVLIGYNRGGHGEPAGLPTTLLVCLAASIAMLQANLLLGTAGRTPDSFVILDLMRLPLGILTGVGFIGAGAIFRQNDMLRGVTTAATLWFVTVIGLCFGGGQIGLGIVGTVVGVGVLWGLKFLEQHLQTEKRALLVMIATAEGPATDDIRAKLQGAGFRIAKFSESCVNTGDLTTSCGAACVGAGCRTTPRCQASFPRWPKPMVSCSYNGSPEARFEHPNSTGAALNPAQQDQDQENNDHHAKATAAVVTGSVERAPAEATEATKKNDDQYDENDGSDRHDISSLNNFCRMPVWPTLIDRMYCFNGPAKCGPCQFNNTTTRCVELFRKYFGRGGTNDSFARWLHC